MASSYYAVDSAVLDGDSFTVRLTTGQARPEPNVRIVLFRRGDTEVLFTGSSFIKSVHDEQDPHHPGASFRRLAMATVEGFHEPRRLTALGGSLEKVRLHHLEPWRHFARSIVALTQRDYHTIVANTPSVSRSIFRFLFAALPTEVKAEFVRLHIEDIAPQPDRLIRDYRNAAKSILAFFHDRVERPIRLLESTVLAHREFTENAQLHQSTIPPLGCLILSNDNDDTQLPLGASCKSAMALLATNSLFQSVGDLPTLLKECLQQLDETESSHESELQWNDPIF